MNNISTYDIELVKVYGLETYYLHIYFTTGETAVHQFLSKEAAVSRLKMYLSAAKAA